MDREHFDALTRLFAAKGSRRAALSALVGAALFGSDPDATDALQDLRGEHRRRRRRRGRRRGRRGCKGAGRWPSFRKSCCPGLVLDATGRCAVPCGPDGTCCPGGRCTGGVCHPCPWGQRCNGNQCVCDGQSCPHGCCDAQGNCQAGTTDSVCGNLGNACLACANPNPVCSNQSCTTCTAERRCPGGCCDIPTGTCQPGSAATACGSVGGTCATCSGEAPTCGASGVCVCTATSCATGCCDGTVCQTGNSNDACGNSGICDVCTGTATPNCDDASGSCVL